MPRASEYLSSPRSVELRRTMVDRQLRTFDVTNVEVLEAVIATPREPFLDGEPDSLIYSDAALEARGSSVRRPLLAPMFVARALQLAEIRPGESLLDVAGGAGYSAAIAARLAGSVTALEDDEALVARAAEAFADLGLSNARAVRGDLALGPAGDERYDVIVINGAVGKRPDALLARLTDGGRLLAVETGMGGSRGASRFVLYSRAGDSVGSRPLFGAAAEVIPAFAAPREFVF
ncbi:MAG: protein-L-isoaspartate O-methyltransferase [Beijerinckiaceae bacterium]|nr:protein-L-isoaspartate O-methyltransferase [Beijerinckiaceae bacterium]